MIKHISVSELAENLGISHSAISKYKLPEPDVIISRNHGWLTETIDGWNSERPGRGNWKPKGK